MHNRAPARSIWRNLHPGVNGNPKALGLGMQLSHRVRVHVWQQPRQQFEDRDLGSSSGIDMAEFESDDAAADKRDAFGQGPFAQRIVRGDHQFGAGKRQPARL